MNRSTPALLLAALLGAGATWILVGNREAEPAVPPPPAAAPAPQPKVAAPPPVVQGEIVPPPDAKPESLLLLPDGSRVPALNGVVNPPKLLWQAPQWSPIVRIERHGTLDWYRHEDGSYSTTMMTFRSDLGREDATSFSLHPLAPAPVSPLEAQDTPPVRRQ